MNNTIKDLLERRSVHNFNNIKVEKEKLEIILKTGSYAANGNGQQSARIVVTQNDELVKTISKLNADVMGVKTDPFYGDTTIVTVLADKNQPTYIEDGSLVLGNIMNAAHALAVDSCWIHRAKEVFATKWGQDFLAKINLSTDFIGIGHCALGYRASDYPIAAKRKDKYIINADDYSII